MNEQQSDYDTLVLSGGSYKGIILLGALHYFIDKGKLNNTKTYVGTSVGAIISYLLCIGYHPLEIITYICTSEILEKMSCLNLVSLTNGNGAQSFSLIQEVLEKMTLDKIGRYITMRELNEEYGKTLICTTYNRTRSLTEYISHDNYPSLPCLTALRMSSNVPFLFEKFFYMGYEYIDGGIADNFPVLKGEEIGNSILALSLAPEKKIDDEKENMIQYFYNLLYIPVLENLKYKKSLSKNANIFEIPSGRLKFFEFNIDISSRLDMYTKGFSYVKKKDRERSHINSQDKI